METNVALALIGGFGTILSTLLSIMLGEMRALRKDVDYIKAVVLSRSELIDVNKMRDRENSLEYKKNAKR